VPRGAVEAGDGASEAGCVGLAPHGEAEDEEERPDEEGEDAARCHALPLRWAGPGRRMLGEEGAAASIESPVRALLSPLRALLTYRAGARRSCVFGVRGGYMWGPGWLRSTAQKTRGHGDRPG
jgi:hypothetical protein